MLRFYTGVSSGNGGTIVESGQGVAATQFATGRTGSSNPEYTISVSGLNFTLTSGTYWLGVAPTGITGQDVSLISTTSGSGAMGKPTVSTGNSFYYTQSGSNFQPASIATGDANLTNFSMGITGSAVSVPFEFSPTWGIVILAVWGAIVKLKPNQRK